MALYEVKAVCTGTVYETWHVEIPDDVDTSGFDLADWLDGDYLPSCVDESVDDEHDRELIAAARIDVIEVRGG